MQRFEDSYLPVDGYYHGIYKVGEKNFVRKVNALLEATKQKLSVEWDFNTKLYSEKINSINNYDYNLLDLYRIRAQQIRDKYSYLVLCYSGGVDSHNILQTFLQNNIKIDEIVCDFPLKLADKANYKIVKNNYYQNLISEYFFTVKPDIEFLQNNYPDIKITLLDSFSETSVLTFEQSISYCSEPAHYATVKRWKAIADHVNGIKQNHMTLIMAVDKPFIQIKENEYGFMFIDPPTNIKPDILHTDKCKMEFFYWSPDLLEIPIIQAKNVWNYIFLDSKYAQSVFKAQKVGAKIFQSRSQGFNPIINLICYPYWDENRHQVDKGSFYQGQYKLMSNKFTEYNFLKESTNNLQEVIRQIDKKFFTNGVNLNDDTKVCYNFHSLGKLPNDWSLL